MLHDQPLLILEADPVQCARWSPLLWPFMVRRSLLGMRDGWPEWASSGQHESGTMFVDALQLGPRNMSTMYLATSIHALSVLGMPGFFAGYLPRTMLYVAP